MPLGHGENETHSIVVIVLHVVVLQQCSAVFPDALTSLGLAVSELESQDSIESVEYSSLYTSAQLDEILEQEKSD